MNLNHQPIGSKRLSRFVRSLTIGASTLCFALSLNCLLCSTVTTSFGTYEHWTKNKLTFIENNQLDLYKRSDKHHTALTALNQKMEQMMIAKHQITAKLETILPEEHELRPSESLPNTTTEI